MPLVLLEAMASGMPVVTTESSGMTDLVEDSHDGLFVIPGNAESLRQRLSNFAAILSYRLRLAVPRRKR